MNNISGNEDSGGSGANLHHCTRMSKDSCPMDCVQTGVVVTGKVGGHWPTSTQTVV
jgi:hypothetical protein